MQAFKPFSQLPCTCTFIICTARDIHLTTPFQENGKNNTFSPLFGKLCYLSINCYTFQHLVTTSTRCSSLLSISICINEAHLTTRSPENDLKPHFGLFLSLIMLTMHKLCWSAEPWLLLPAEYLSHPSEDARSDQSNKPKGEKISYLALNLFFLVIFSHNYADYA